MAIVYKNQEIGFVKKISFDDKNSKVELFIYQDFKKFITNKSRFYKKPKLELNASLSGIIFELDSFSSLIDGSIELDNSSNTPLGNRVLYSSFDEMQLATNMVTIIFDFVTLSVFVLDKVGNCEGDPISFFTLDAFQLSDLGGGVNIEHS